MIYTGYGLTCALYKDTTARLTEEQLQDAMSIFTYAPPRDIEKISVYCISIKSPLLQKG